MDELSQLISLVEALPGPAIKLAGGAVNDSINSVAIKEFDHVASAGAKRQREFLCGRYYAHRLLLDLGYTDFTIGRDDKGCPLWPVGISGSISHTNDYCVAAVAHDSSIRSVGVDLEEAGRMKEDLWRRLFTDSEISLLQNIGQPVEQKRHAAIMFSAKEAYYKYDYPLHRRQHEFTDVEVDIDDSSHQFSLHITGEDHNNRLVGRFAFGLTHVMTLIAS